MAVTFYNQISIDVEYNSNTDTVSITGSDQSLKISPYIDTTCDTLVENFMSKIMVGAFNEAPDRVFPNLSVTFLTKYSGGGDLLYNFSYSCSGKYYNDNIKGRPFGTRIYEYDDNDPESIYKWRLYSHTFNHINLNDYCAGILKSEAEANVSIYSQPPSEPAIPTFILTEFCKNDVLTNEIEITSPDWTNVDYIEIKKKDTTGSTYNVVKTVYEGDSLIYTDQTNIDGFYRVYAHNDAYDKFGETKLASFSPNIEAQTTNIDTLEFTAKTTNFCSNVEQVNWYIDGNLTNTTIGNTFTGTLPNKTDFFDITAKYVINSELTSKSNTVKVVFYQETPKEQTFTSDGSFEIEDGYNRMDVLIVGGGGAGGTARGDYDDNGYGGGGGAGGVIHKRINNPTPGLYDVIIGSGGIDGSSGAENSSFYNLIANAGHNGGQGNDYNDTASYTTPVPTNDYGSGGGGGGFTNISIEYGKGSYGTEPYGHDGANGASNRGGGGGGAGSAGSGGSGGSSRTITIGNSEFTVSKGGGTRTSHGYGSNGTNYGDGGGGAASINSTSYIDGGNGADGIVHIFLSNPPKPNKATGLTTSSITTTGATISWVNNNTADVSGNSIRIFSGNTWIEIADLSSGATSYNITGLTPIQTYKVKIVAYNTLHYTHSDENTFTTLDPKPLNLSSTVLFNSITLDWEINDPPFGDSIRPEIRISGDTTWNQLPEIANDATTYTFDKLEYFTTYELRMVRIGSEYESEIVTSTTSDFPVPINLTASEIYSTHAKLEWSNQNTYDSLYLYWYDNYGNDGYEEIDPPTNEYYWLYEIHPDRNHWFYLEATIDGVSDFSDTYLFTTEPFPVPKNLTTTKLYPTIAKFAWSNEYTYDDYDELYLKWSDNIGNSGSVEIVPTYYESAWFYDLYENRYYEFYLEATISGYTDVSESTYVSPPRLVEFCDGTNYSKTDASCGDNDAEITINSDFNNLYNFTLYNTTGGTYSTIEINPDFIKITGLTSGWYKIVATPTIKGLNNYNLSECEVNWIPIETSNSSVSLYNFKEKPIQCGPFDVQRGRLSWSISGASSIYSFYIYREEKPTEIEYSNVGFSGDNAIYSNIIKGGCFYGEIVSEDDGCIYLIDKVCIKSIPVSSIGGIRNLFITPWSFDIDYDYWKTSDEDYFLEVEDTSKFISSKINKYKTLSGNAIQWYKIPVLGTMSLNQSFNKTRQGITFQDTLNVDVPFTAIDRFDEFTDLLENKYVFIIEDNMGQWWTGGYQVGASIESYSKQTGQRDGQNMYSFEIKTKSADKLLTALDKQYINDYIFSEPEAPYNLTVDDKTTSSVTISWDFLALNESYTTQIYSGSTWNDVAQIQSTSYTYENLNSDTSYDFRVINNYLDSQYISESITTSTPKALNDGIYSYFKLDGNGSDYYDNTFLSLGTVTWMSGLINDGMRINDAANTNFSIDNLVWSLSIWIESYSQKTEPEDMLGIDTDYVFRKTTDDKVWLYVYEQGLELDLGAMNINEFYHFVITYDGSNLEIYKNNNYMGNYSANINSNNRFFIGYAWYDDYLFSGLFDEIGYWSRELNEYDIEKLYNNGNGLRPF